MFAASGNKNSDRQSDLPEVASRTYAQNYKDLVLASCIAEAYSGEPKAAADAGATAAGLESTWTNYDLEKSSGQISKLVDRYLARKYNSIHGPDIKLDLLKCLDLYHSKELDAQVKRFVLTPGRTYRQDNPPAKQK
jgi:hypothetical protein